MFGNVFSIAAVVAVTATVRAMAAPTCFPPADRHALAGESFTRSTSYPLLTLRSKADVQHRVLRRPGCAQHCPTSSAVF